MISSFKEGSICQGLATFAVIRRHRDLQVQFVKHLG